MTRKQRRAVDDPHLRACPACGARIGQCCNHGLGKNDKPLVLRATRLVHADRLEQPGGDS